MGGLISNSNLFGFVVWHIVKGIAEKSYRQTLRYQNTVQDTVKAKMVGQHGHSHDKQELIQDGNDQNMPGCFFIMPQQKNVIAQLKR